MEAVSTFPSAVEIAALSGADLDHALVAVEQARREVEAAYLAVLDRADDTKRYTSDGHAGVQGWASTLANTGSVELHRRLQTMRALRDLPASMTGWFRRVIVDSAGVVIDLGHKRRFTGSARVAVILTRRRCRWPGCGRASARNQIDHTHEHSRGGPTTPHNGGPACGRHNRTKSRGYTVHRDADGNWHVHRRNGTDLTEPAAA